MWLAHCSAMVGIGNIPSLTILWLALPLIWLKLQLVFACSYSGSGKNAHHAKPTPHASFSRSGSYNPLAYPLAYLTENPKSCHLLFHRQGIRPGPVLLCLILILMVWLILGVKVCLSVVEIVGSCHSRQARSDF